jgi:hypothetical protein
MYKKTIAFTDYNGVNREEDFYFNLNESEVMKLEMRVPGGLTAMMQRIVQKMDAQQIIDTFEELIRRSYGEKSPDGREFRKSPELVEKFMQTEAYNKLFMELCTDSKAAAEFFNNIVPQKIDIPNGEKLADAPALVPVN